MSEFVKTVLTLMLIGSVLIASIAWWNDRPNEVVWTARIGFSLLAAALFSVLIRRRRPQDRATDYLAVFGARYFNRDGFCFDIDASADDGVCYLVIAYQSQYSKRSEGRIAIRPTSGSWMSRPQFASICVDLAINPGEYGVLRLPVPVSKKLQGKTVSFEIGAAVCYPDGKGERLRFADGVLLRDNQEFGDTFTTEVIDAAAASRFALTSPVVIRVLLPAEVATEFNRDQTIERETAWTYVSE
ncbi:hypothetical protein [Blastopirellula marina]|uniref:Uncharacterized protein n=1 Tax=Blastopirellula marina DSM 3645 TaxID=314230 RepID=A3ZRY7_9BACT|nr:hypothetical protein [Blastopirellula marina]EAQ80909.1 hypothetical protein DSM3645_12851 [Blastopirellula marina DSM 3645]